MRKRLIIAFIVVALLAALASSWFNTLIGAYRLPAWLDYLYFGPSWLRDLVHSDPGSRHRTRCAIPPCSSSGWRPRWCSR